MVFCGVGRRAGAATAAEEQAVLEAEVAVGGELGVEEDDEALEEEGPRKEQHVLRQLERVAHRILAPVRAHQHPQQARLRVLAPQAPLHLLVPQPLQLLRTAHPRPRTYVSAPRAATPRHAPRRRATGAVGGGRGSES